MAQLIVRNLDGAVKEQLRAQARRHGRSMEEEARVILSNSIEAQPFPALKDMGAWIMAQRAGEEPVGGDTMDEFNHAIQELRQSSWGTPVDLGDDHS